MTEVEKLIELLDGFSTPVTLNGEKLMDWNIPMQGLRKAIADYLISNGVTFQKWIPVNEGFPTKRFSSCIVYRENSMGSHYSMVHYSPKLGFHFYDSEWGDVTLDDVTHWMPLPEPPQEVSDGQT